MSEEELIPRITVTKENLTGAGLDSGGAIRDVQVNIIVDSAQVPRNQAISCVFEVLGSYFGIFCSNLDLGEVTERIIEGLEALNQASWCNKEEESVNGGEKTPPAPP